MRYFIAASVLVTILGSALTAEATFENFRHTPAELGSPWQSVSNQREVYLDLNVHPDVPPGPIDGAVYTGDLDPVLSDLDEAIYGLFGTGVTFIEPAGQTAAAVSPSGTTIVEMSDPDYWILIRLKNRTDFTGFKEIWVEWVSTAPTITDVSIGDWLDVWASGDVTVADVHHNKIDGFHGGSLDWYTTNVLLRIVPNPTVESIIFRVPEPNGAEDYYIDTIAIATNCIPEPSAMTIWLFLGGWGILVARRRR